MVGHLGFIRPNVLWPENAFKSTDYAPISVYSGICLFDGYKRLDKPLSNIFSNSPHITPMCPFRNFYCKILGLHIGVFNASLCCIVIELLIKYIAYTLEEKQWKNIFFVAGRINLTAQASSGSPKKLLHFVECQSANLFRHFIFFYSTHTVVFMSDENSFSAASTSAMALRNSASTSAYGRTFSL